jgi:hypothetical protein
MLFPSRAQWQVQELGGVQVTTAIGATDDQHAMAIDESSLGSWQQLNVDQSLL